MTKIKKRSSRLALIAAVLLWAGWAQAQQLASASDAVSPAQKRSATSESNASKRLPDSLPLKIKTGIFLVDITHIDIPSVPIPHFTAEYILSLKWKDERWKYQPTEDMPYQQYHDHEVDTQLQKMWWPEIAIPNQDGPRITENKVMKIGEKGDIHYFEKFKINLKMSSNLRKFPFDEQEFKLYIELYDWDTSVVQLIRDPDASGMSGEISNEGWALEQAELINSSTIDQITGSTHSLVKHVVTAERVPDFYLFKIITPLLMILCFTWSTFWMVGENASLRLQRLVIAMLAMIAFHQVIVSNLPRIGSITFIDALVYLCFISVGFTVLHLIIFHNLERLNQKERGMRMDKRAKYLYPSFFLGAVVVVWVYYHYI